MLARRWFAFSLVVCLGACACAWAEAQAGTQANPTPRAREGIESQSLEEKEAFELAKEVGTKEAWNAFLKRFPSGFYADLARAALAKGETPAPRPDPAPRREPRVQPAPEQAALPPHSGESFWLHNGSLMRLEANDAARRFYYVRPRAGIAEQGARAGTLLFEGRKDGDRYSGRAFIFNRRCGRFAYDVSGHVESGQTRVVMFGKAPRPGPGCAVEGYRDDTLVFDYQGR